jgi:predicted TIM-barrel fold metal-dependent hydrolase
MSERLPIIDTHIHLWDFKHPELVWDWLLPEATHPILGNIDALKSQRYLLDDLWAETRFANISAFVHIQAAIGSPNYVTETRWLQKMSETGPVPMKIVANVALGSDTALSELAQHCESSNFVGIRDFQAEPMLASGVVDPTYEKSLEFLTQNSLVFDLDCEWMNMPAAVVLAGRHPNLKIVLEHIGFPRRRDDEYFENWKKGVAALAQAPNVIMKISGLGMTDPRFTKASLQRWVDVCLEEFGPDRCVLGSNWPVDRLYSSYDVIMDMERDFISTLTHAEQVKITTANAKRIYNF